MLLTGYHWDAYACAPKPSAADVTNVVIDGVTIARDGLHHRIDVAETLATTIQELFS